MPGLASAQGLIGFLSEPDVDLRVFALKALDEQIDALWIEVAPSIHEIESLSEDESFPERQLASLVASKVYYNLQEYNESMVFALGAGKLLNLDNGGEFEQTIISKCVDTFIALSTMSKTANKSAPTNTFNPTETTAPASSLTTPFSQSAVPSKSLLSRPESDSQEFVNQGTDAKTSAEISLVLQRGVEKHLHSIVERLFETCFQEKRYRQVVGIAVEAKDLNVLKTAILRASSDAKQAGETSTPGRDLMEYVLEICMSVVPERGFRNEILRLILGLLDELPSPDHFAIAKCVVYLNEHSIASDMLHQLVEKGDARSIAVAYQISFDLYDNSTQEFLRKLREQISQYIPGHPVPAENGDGESGETDALLHNQDVSPSHEISETTTAYIAIRDILDGVNSIRLDLEFLQRNNKADIEILNKIKNSLDGRNSLYHSAVSICTAFMYAGTTCDKFFRDNLEWLGKATNWSKFTATAALGVVHLGNLTQGQRLLTPYLPRDPGTDTGSPYSQGGALFAYGLIYANHQGWALDIIRKHFRQSGDEVVKHGGALGLGMAGMATADEEIYSDLRDVLYADSAINGEAVGTAMGLIMLGTGNETALKDLIQYAHQTEHDKIIRGCALGMAFVVYGRQEGADELINGLLSDPDFKLRYGGIMSIAMAYCGTGSNKAIRKLLHVAVSDVNDDVRRVAVMSLGFILCRKYQNVPRMVELLSESYNPHVRYGAAMALGISCAGTGLAEAIELLEPLTKDPVDFVRQGSLIALSLVLVQQNETMNPKVGAIRQKMQKTVSSRQEDGMSRFGCAMALGIIDAGGKNCTISLTTRSGNLSMTGVIGAAVFTQYWYWFPFAHFLSLSFAPTAVIGVDQRLEVPHFKFHSNTRPSLFDYPPEQQAKTDEAVEKVKTAVLSTTAQAKRRAAQRSKQQGEKPSEKMDIDEGAGTEKEADADKEGKQDKEQGGAKRKVEKEKIGYDLDNMSRVLPAQVKYLSFPDTRYEPVKPTTGGVMVVVDKRPDEPRETIELLASQPSPAPSVAPQQQEAAPSQQAATTDQQVSEGGASAAAGVLSAIDEDVEEAPVPGEFDYHTDNDENMQD